MPGQAEHARHRRRNRRAPRYLSLMARDVCPCAARSRGAQPCFSLYKTPPFPRTPLPGLWAGPPVRATAHQKGRSAAHPAGQQDFNSASLAHARAPGALPAGPATYAHCRAVARAPDACDRVATRRVRHEARGRSWTPRTGDSATSQPPPRPDAHPHNRPIDAAS